LVLDIFLSLGEIYLTRLDRDSDPLILDDVALCGNLILERVIAFLQVKFFSYKKFP